MNITERMVEKYRGLLVAHGERLGYTNLVSVSVWLSGALVSLDSAELWGKTGEARGTLSYDANRVKSRLAPGVEPTKRAGVLSFTKSCPVEYFSGCEWVELGTHGRFNVLCVSALHSPLCWEIVVQETSEEIGKFV